MVHNQRNCKDIFFFIARRWANGEESAMNHQWVIRGGEYEERVDKLEPCYASLFSQIWT